MKRSAYYYNNTETRTETARQVSFAPLFRLGLTLFPDHLFSIQADVSYIGYANTAHAFGQTFDLGVAGVAWRALAVIRLYLSIID